MPEDPLIGQQLANYRVERVLGRGGMAVVYYATDIKLQRPAAIKVIDARFRGNPAYAERFIQEARAVATWRHEHILQVYYADEVYQEGLDGVFFFAMEYIDGKNLADELAEYVERGERIPYAEVLRYGRAVASALDYAHARGVIHRDVKPSNVLVSNDGRVVLSDFGLALDTQQGSLGEVFGTAHYTAPEQARRSNAAVPQSDLYSLGVMLYEMLCGVVPFDDPSPTSVALQHITQPVPAPRVLNPQLSAKVEAVLLKALSKQPEQRFRDGAVMMAALEEALREMSPAQLTMKTNPLPLPPAGVTAGTPPSHPWAGDGADLSSPNPLNQEEKSQEEYSQGKAVRPGISRYRPGKGRLALILTAAGILVLGGMICTVSSLLRNFPGEKSGNPPISVAVETQHAIVTPSQNSPEAKNTDLATTMAPDPGQNNAMTATVEQPVIGLTQIPANPTPSWTPKYAVGRKMILLWDVNSFYMLQATGYGELIDPLVFERLDANGQPVERFSGKLWAEFHSSTLRDWCMRLIIGGASGPALDPPQCKSQYLATRWPQPGETILFWTPKEGSHLFRVLWGRDELQRCEISAGTCEVYLP
jgi:serine/threonine protein kinase